jgi:molybdopterin-biosynthesis enzyme MoeA-like protein
MDTDKLPYSPTVGAPPIKPAVVTVGDELILGERSNDNQVWLLRFLQEQSSPAAVALTLPDSVEIIALGLQELLHHRFYPILVSGGIGGTHDDCTREGVARALRRPLTRHPACHRILAAKYGTQYTSGRQRMAQLPEGCDLIVNPGGAPGFTMSGIYAFPGFPSMLQPMAREVLARILPVAPTGAGVTREYTLALHEGQIALDIEAFAKAHAETRIGIYPSAASFRREVTVRLRCARGREGVLEAFDQLIAAIQQKYGLAEANKVET